MSRVASGISGILTILLAPLIYALVLQILYHTDPITVLLEGPEGWFKYTVAAFISLIVTTLAVAAMMRGGSRALCA